MTYVLLSDHPEPLHDGRMVENGAQLSDSDAEKNPRLIERGVLVKEEVRESKPHHKKAEPKAGHDTAAESQEKEDSK
jgi:hypothetical protein